MLPPSLSELTARFLTESAPETLSSEVVPHELLTSFRIDPRTAWAGARSAIALTAGTDVAKQFPMAMPTDWASFVAGAEMVALTMCTGHYPQMVRDINKVMTGEFDYKVMPEPAALLRWAKQAEQKGTSEQKLFASAIWRMAGHKDEALQTFADAAEGLPESLLNNETAALDFAFGNYDAALALWETEPESGVSQFNIGVTQMVLNNRTDAAKAFRLAIQKLPEDSDWNSLASLYLTAMETDDVSI